MTAAKPSLSVPDSEDSHIQLTTSPTLNFLQLAVLVTQRAPAPGVSAVQARGMNGGIAREWESLVRRYSSLGGCLRQQEVQEVRSRSPRTARANKSRQDPASDLNECIPDTSPARSREQ